MIDSFEDPAPRAALELCGITKRFGSVTALDGVDLVVSPGSTHALLGENGAGKSTLMRIAYGLVPADGGDIRVFGEVLGREHTVRHALRFGVGMVHQHLSVAPNLTAAENLVLGGRGLYDAKSAAGLLERTMESSGLRVPSDVLARDLSIVEQQRLEILKALARGARLLILDEPTAVLAPSEADDLMRWIRGFVATGGSVVLVTHKLPEALAIADDVTVLRRGRAAHSAKRGHGSEHDLAMAMFPEAPPESAPPESAPPAEAATPAGDIVARATSVDIMDARGARRIRGASFAVHRHQIVGIAAVEGSGHRELLLALAGLRPPTTGTLELPRRIGFIPSDRQRDALVPDFTLVENVALHNLNSRRGLMPWRTLSHHTGRLLARFSITAASIRAPARSLSGGNQQRLVVARELEREVDLVVADNPTRGLDIRATAFVHQQLRHAAAMGAAVVMHSSDLDEVLSLATRVLVVFHGTVSEVPARREEVGRAMLGAS